MKKYLHLIAAIALASAATGAPALGAGPPPTRGTISIEPRAVDGSDDAALPAFVDAAAAVLTAQGFAVLGTPGHAAYVVELLVSRAEVGTGLAKVQGGPPSAMGAGIAIPLANGASQLVSLQRTRLEMRIRKRNSTDIVWDGVAVTVRGAGTRKGAPETVAADLSRVLFQSYPAQSKEIVGVP